MLALLTNRRRPAYTRAARPLRLAVPLLIACGGGEGGGVVAGPVIEGPMTGQFVDILQTNPTRVSARGRIVGCLGEDCPAGECNASQLAAEPSCDAGYPDPIDSLGEWCEAAGDVSVCLELEDGGDVIDWAVNCGESQGQATACGMPDDTSCGVDARARCAE